MKIKKYNYSLGIAFVIAILFLGPSDSFGQFQMPNTLVPITNNDYPIVYANDAKGGHHQVANITARNAITSLRRQVGMLCTVLDNSAGSDGSGVPQTFQLICADTKAARDNNTSWVVFTPGGAASGVTVGGESYLSIVGQAITAGKIDLAANTTGTLSASSFPALTGDVVAVAGTLRTDISSAAVTYDKMQRLSTHNLLLGSDASGATTTVSEITLGTNLTMTGNTLNAAGSGDVKGPATNTDGFIPLWNGINSKLLQDGIAVPAGGLVGLDAFNLLTTTANSKLTANTAITAATKTKLTYDLNGLVTAGADATTADIAASTDKNYVTDAQLAIIVSTVGVNTGDETQATIKTKLGSATGSADGYLTTADWNIFNGKAPVASPAFTGTPTAPTATKGDSSTNLATTAFVSAAVSSVLASGGVLYQGTAADLSTFNGLTWSNITSATVLGNSIRGTICALSTTGYTWVACPVIWGEQKFFLSYGGQTYPFIDGIQKRVFPALTTGSVDYQVWIFKTTPDIAVNLIVNN